MTCLDMYRANAGYSLADEDVYTTFCPSEFHYMADPRCCRVKQATFSECRECWNREPCNCYAIEHGLSVCNGTKERETCTCGGDKRKCSFYPYEEHGLIVGDEKVEHPDTDIPYIHPDKRHYVRSEPKSIIKDSGDRTEFETGAVRDMREGKGRCDLMPLDVLTEWALGTYDTSDIVSKIRQFMKDGDVFSLYDALTAFSKERYGHPISLILDVSIHFEQGAKKYGENNWQKGIPVNCYIDSAIRHYLKYLRDDDDEPHDRAFCWNLMCAIWTCEHMPELNGYRKEE